MNLSPARLLRYLVIIVIGNILYFMAMPHLPEAARHNLFTLDLGTLLDFCLSLVFLGVF